MHDSSIDEAVDICIEDNFKFNSIKYIKHLHKFNLPKGFSLWQIENEKLSLLEPQSTPFDQFRLSHVFDIFGSIAPKIKYLKCKFILNLGDEPNQDYKYSSFCFSCPHESNHLQIPDPHIYKYINHPSLLNCSINDISFDSKKNIASFRGSDTGQISDDLKNDRIRFCSKYISSQIIDAKITDYHRFNEHLLSALGCSIELISAKRQSFIEQLKNKYIIDIVGNTSAWDRIVWVTASNSILIKIKSESCLDHCWYWPYIKKSGFIPEIDMMDVEEYISSPPSSVEKINEGQTRLNSTILMNRRAHEQYLQKLLIKYNNLYNS